jgi:hypothetical protein
VLSLSRAGPPSLLLALLISSVPQVGVARAQVAVIYRLGFLLSVFSSISGNDSSSQHAFVDFVSRWILLPHKDFSFSYPTKECDSLTSMSDFSHQRKDFSALVLSPVIFHLASTFCLISV